jgi:hypothetical protein
MRRIGGRCQRSVRRCLRANGEATTAQIMAWAGSASAAHRPCAMRQAGSRSRAVEYGQAAMYADGLKTAVDAVLLLSRPITAILTC